MSHEAAVESSAHGRQDDGADAEDDEAGQAGHEGREAARAAAVGVTGKRGGCGHAVTPVEMCRGSRATATATMMKR